MELSRKHHNKINADCITYIIKERYFYAAAEQIKKQISNDPWNGQL